MTRQVTQLRMKGTSVAGRRRFELMAAEYLERMGQRMRERREELGLSRSQVARAMPGKTTENQVYRWEKGLHRPQDDTLEALVAVLKVNDVSYFLAAQPDKTETPDLVGTMSGERSQLNRIETLLLENQRIMRDLAAGLMPDEPAQGGPPWAALARRLEQLDARDREASPPVTPRRTSTNR